MGEEKRSMSLRSGNMEIMQELRILSDKLEHVQSSIKRELNSKVDSLKSTLEKLVNMHKEELKAEIESRAKQIQDNIDLEIGHLTARMDSMEAVINGSKTKAVTRFDPDVSIIISGLEAEVDEDLSEKVRTLLTEGAQCQPLPELVAAERMRARGSGPGVIKVELRTTQDKVAILRQKRNLKRDDRYKRVYIRAAKSHTDRLVELNFKTLLREIPTGKSFYISGNGRVMRKDDDPAGSRSRGAASPLQGRSDHPGDR